MKPKLFTHESWFIRASNAIKAYQKEVTDVEEKLKGRVNDLFNLF